MMFPLVPLKEIIVFKGGGTPSKKIPEYWDGGIPWATVKDFKGKKLSETQDSISLKGLNESASNLIPKGHVIIPTRMALGKAAINTVDVAINQDLRALIPKQKIYTEYLLYAVLSLAGEIEKKGSGATVKGITQDNLYNLKIPFPEYNDQIRIATLLSRVEALIATRKNNLKQLDNFLKSTFLEMFGDIRAKKSKYKWEMPRPYLKASSGKSSKNVKTEKQTEIPIYGGNGVNGWATEPLYFEPVVIAGRVGQQCGIIHVSDGPCWVTDNAIVIQIVDTNILDATYLATAYQHAPIREKVKQLDLPFINQSMLLDYSIPMPPIELQRKFAQISEKVLSLKVIYQKNLGLIENLYGALSQKAFKGELELSRVPLTDVDTTKYRHVTVTDQGTGVDEVSRIVEYPMSDPAERTKLLRNLFDEFLSQHKGGNLSLDDFWQHAILMAGDSVDAEDDKLWGVEDYDRVKEWLFELIREDKLEQRFIMKTDSSPDDQIQLEIIG